MSSTTPHAVQQVLRTSGKPLDPHIRMSMEAALPPDLHSRPMEANRLEQAADTAADTALSGKGDRGSYDFSSVRVHDDAQAAESARAINADAYTSGSHIVFDSGRYDPHSSEGRKLLAHELTHVVQQSSGSAVTGAIQRQPKKTVRDILGPVTIEQQKLDCSDVRLQRGEMPGPKVRECFGDAMFKQIESEAFFFRLHAENQRMQQFFDSPAGLILKPLHEQVHRALGFSNAVLLEVLEKVAVNNITLVTTINHYEDAGFGDMLRDVRNRLRAGPDFDKAMRLLHGGTPRFKCVPGEHEMLLEAKSIALSMARSAALLISADLKAGQISTKVKSAFNKHFNPGGAGSVSLFKRLREIRNVLLSAWGNMLEPVAFRCMESSHDDWDFSTCSDPKKKAAAYTRFERMGTVFICPGFWKHDPTWKGMAVLHEFVHHQFKRDNPKGEQITDRAYIGEEKYEKLTPQLKGSATDSLSNADSYANFARELF